MKRLLLLATTTGYQANEFRAAAGRMGVPISIASDRCHVLEDPWRDGALAVRFEHPEESARRIVEFARRTPIAGIAAIGDAPTVTAALACHRLGLEYNSSEAVEICRDKFRTRECMAQAGLHVPWYLRAAAGSRPESLAKKVPFPCVLKPLGLSASRGVIRADDREGFAAAFRRIRLLLRSPEVRRTNPEAAKWIQVESFIPGREVAVEGLLTRGKLRVLAIFDKPDPLDGPYFEETIYVTPSQLPGATQRAIVECTERAVAAVDLRHGPLHAELRVNDEGAWLLEMAARPIGGLCARALRFGEQRMPLEELILRHALGEAVESLAREPEASSVMMIPIARAGVYEGVEGVEEASRTPGVTGIEITAKLRQKLVPLPEGASYLGFIFARGATPEVVEQALRQAHAKLRFAISANLPVVTKA
ncbi:MAG TPA: ATP-grasp domain-containing protein [Terriglobales bacterium]|jgi:biotin carboxylase|nr:ATP-grasp domain-containing protein [Terriglobales bacterium]